MGYRRTALAPDETYHCYTRGIDKRITFQDTEDYERFLQALYVCNDAESFHRASISNSPLPHREIFTLPRGIPLVSILAYCLMPNHYHLVLRELTEGGISKFMQRVGTMYTMYFNAKNERVGGLFIGPFRSRHINDDVYLKRVIQYLHLNPAELFEPEWKQGKFSSRDNLEKKLQEYPFSSLPEYGNAKRAEYPILDTHAVRDLHDTLPSLRSSVGEAAEYYTSLRW